MPDFTSGQTAEAVVHQRTGSDRCLGCQHSEEHYTHLTGCVVCKYPRERVPRVVDKSLLRMGRWCVPNNTAVICPHYTPRANLWCAFCGKWSDHQSGWCPEIAEREDAGNRDQNNETVRTPLAGPAPKTTISPTASEGSHA